MCWKEDEQFSVLQRSSYCVFSVLLVRAHLLSLRLVQFLPSRIFGKSAWKPLLSSIQAPLVRKEPPALSAGAAADAGRTGSNYQYQEKFGN